MDGLQGQKTAFHGYISSVQVHLKNFQGTPWPLNPCTWLLQSTLAFPDEIVGIPIDPRTWWNEKENTRWYNN